MSESGKSLASRGVVIAGCGSYAPAGVLTNADLERIVETSDEWIVTRTGIRERRIAAPEVATCDLAYEAALKALEMARCTALDVDTIIFATVTPDRMLPSASCTLQERLGAVHAAAFDLNAACSGFVYGLSVGTGMIASGLSDTVLLIGAETLSRVTDYKDRSTCVLFGDGAGAVVLRPCESGRGMLSVRLRSDGSQGDLLEIPSGGSRQPSSHETVEARGHFIKMRGNELFKFAVRSMEAVTRQALADAGVTAEELALLIPHQANLRILTATAERLGLGPDRLIVNIDRYGNTSAASIPLTLDETVRTGRLRKGDLFGMVAFGGGVTWGAAIAEWDPLLALPAHSERGAARATEPVEVEKTP